MDTRPLQVRRGVALDHVRLAGPIPERRPLMADLEQEISELLEGHRLQPNQLQALQHGDLDADTVRRLQRMVANTQNALLRLAREIDQMRAAG